jgi:hypothetical protein
MNNVKETQNHRKIILTFAVLTLVLAVALTPSVSYVKAVPPDDRWGGESTCEAEFKGDRYFLNCCWREPIPGSILGKAYCQKCENTGTSDNPVWTCEPKQPQAFESTTERDEAVPPRDGEVLDETQPTNPTFNPNKGTIINENLAEDQPIQFSSNEEQSQGSEESSEEINPNTESNSQENDGSSTSESTTSLSKRGNTQNSPVPPECPKQGPIPPDCTLKPKF